MFAPSLVFDVRRATWKLRRSLDICGMFTPSPKVLCRPSAGFKKPGSVHGFQTQSPLAVETRFPVPLSAVTFRMRNSEIQPSNTHDFIAAQARCQEKSGDCPRSVSPYLRDAADHHEGVVPLSACEGMQDHRPVSRMREKRTYGSGERDRAMVLPTCIICVASLR